MIARRVLPVAFAVAIAGCSGGTTPGAGGEPSPTGETSPAGGAAPPGNDPDLRAPSPEGWRGTIEARGGAVIVANPEEGLWESLPETPIRFELEATYGVDAEPRDAILGRIAGVAVDDDGNVYVLDSQAHQLIGFDADGGVRWRVGREGEGPEEFSGVRGLAFDGRDTLHVVNRAGSRIDRWALDGGYLGTNALQEEVGLSFVFLGGFLRPDRLALVDQLFETAANDYVVVRLGDPLQIETRFRISSDPEMPIPPGFIFQLSHRFVGDKILLGNWERYVLRVFDDAGNLERRVTRPVGYLRRMGFASQGRSTRGMNFGGLSAPVVLDSGHWLAMASWPTNVDDPNAFAALDPERRDPIEWASSIDVFDPDGRFLISLPAPGEAVPDIGSPWSVGPDGALYTVNADPYPHVRRYRVTIEESR